MGTINLTAIILAVIGTVSGWVTYLLDHRKHKKEIEAITKSIQAETEKKHMELAKMYVDEFTKNIVKPLEDRVNKLTNESPRRDDSRWIKYFEWLFGH